MARTMNDGRGKHTAEEFTRARNYINLLYNCERMLTTQEMHELRERALSGDLDGAYRALDKSLAGMGRL